jgi:hypothetical protein
MRLICVRQRECAEIGQKQVGEILSYWPIKIVFGPAEGFSFDRQAANTGANSSRKGVN